MQLIYILIPFRSAAASPRVKIPLFTQICIHYVHSILHTTERYELQPEFIARCVKPCRCKVRILLVGLNVDDLPIAVGLTIFKALYKVSLFV